MMRFGLFPPGSRVSEVLFIGAHSDDIEIGCGATVLRLIEENPGLRVNWVVFSATGEREKEARRGAEAFLTGARDARVEIHGFRNAYFPWAGAEIKDCFERMKDALSPDVIFTHRRDDAHQDHRTLCDLTWNTWRDHLVLEYEVPKYDGDLGQPNLYVPVSAQTTARKIAHLMRVFATQRPRQWFTEDTFRGLMRLRGVESCAPEQFAEAFYCRKLVL